MVCISVSQMAKDWKDQEADHRRDEWTALKKTLEEQVYEKFGKT